MKKRKSKSRERWTETEARRVLAKHRASGKSVAKFAQDEGLVAERLGWWQRRLGKSRGRAGAKGIEFAEVRSVATASVAGRFEVVLAGGRRLWVPAGFAAEDMVRLVAVLEGRPC